MEFRLQAAERGMIREAWGLPIPLWKAGTSCGLIVDAENFQTSVKSEESNVS